MTFLCCRPENVLGFYWKLAFNRNGVFEWNWTHDAVHRAVRHVHWNYSV